MNTVKITANGRILRNVQGTWKFSTTEWLSLVDEKTRKEFEKLYPKK